MFFTILPWHILYIECPFGRSYGRTYKTNLSSKHRRTEAVFHLNNRMNTLLNLKRNLNTFIRIFIRNTLVLALKISKMGVGVYFGTPCYGYALNCLFLYLVIQGTRPLFKRKQMLFILSTCSLVKKIHICLNKHETGLVYRSLLKAILHHLSCLM